MNFLYTFIFLFFICQLCAQTDTLLKIQKMGAAEIILYEDNSLNQKIVSASQSLREIKDLPFTIHVITEEEIAANGYVTLVDALKMVPGIRVSQPGSALEGETFLMRGLLGNAYTKILINGVDIKPSVVNGMPLGAQLPIQQAARIEIIYGPVAALYGADAAAGVINIILKETERPLFTQTGLQIGGGDFTSLDILFGGKLGKNDKVVKFNVYANNTVYQKRPIKHISNLTLFIPNTYILEIEPIKSPNFIGRDGETSVKVGNLPHLSRLVGGNLTYKDMTLSVDVMYRRDHSSLGLNPGAVSYTNPLNYFGERIINGSFKLSKQYNKWGFNTKLAGLYYQVDEHSSSTYIANTLGNGFNAFNGDFVTDPITGLFDEAKFDELFLENFDTYFSGNRFSFGESINGRVEQIFTFYPIKSFELTAGASFNAYHNTPLTQFSPIPLKDLTIIRNGGVNTAATADVPFLPASFFDYDLSSFIQGYFTLDKLTMIGGAQFYWHSNFGQSINPRIALLYQLLPNLSLRTFYGTAFRRPPQFFETNNYVINGVNSISRVKNELSPEKTSSFEFGLRWASAKKLNVDIVYFNTSTNNLIFFDIRVNNSPNDRLESLLIGYFNFEATKTNLSGIQSSFRLDNIWRPIKLNTSLHLQVAQIKEVLPTADEIFAGAISEQPRLMIQSRTSFRPFKNTVITLDNIFMGKFRQKGFVWNLEEEKFQNYYSLDIQLRYSINKNLQTFIKLNNVFGREYAGLSASGTGDDLLYNPQRTRFVRLGLNYRLN